jgi:hypothetical protein
MTSVPSAGGAGTEARWEAIKHRAQNKEASGLTAQDGKDTSIKAMRAKRDKDNGYKSNRVNISEMQNDADYWGNNPYRQMMKAEAM